MVWLGRQDSPRPSRHARPPGSPSKSSKTVTFSPTPSLRKSFSCNTYEPPRKCCKQKTYGLAKPFRCNTYKKHGGRHSFDSETRHPTHLSPLHQALSFHTLAHSFALIKNSTPFLPIVSALFAKNHPGGRYPSILTSLPSYVLISLSTPVTGLPRPCRGHQSLYHSTP